MDFKQTSAKHVWWPEDTSRNPWLSTEQTYTWWLFHLCQYHICCRALVYPIGKKYLRPWRIQWGTHHCLSPRYYRMVRIREPAPCLYTINLFVWLARAGRQPKLLEMGPQKMIATKEDAYHNYRDFLQSLRNLQIIHVDGMFDYKPSILG